MIDIKEESNPTVFTVWYSWGYDHILISTDRIKLAALINAKHHFLLQIAHIEKEIKAIERKPHANVTATSQLSKNA